VCTKINYILFAQTVYTVCTRINYIFFAQTVYTVCRRINYIFIAQSVYTVCTKINYKIVPVTSMNKYLHCCTSGTEQYVYKYRGK